MGMEEVQEGLESDFERNKQLTLRPEFSSTTSYLDSNETFLSDRATEEYFDLQLQGISSLMDDSKPTVNKEKQGLVHNDTPLDHPSSLFMPQSYGKVE